MQQTCRAIRNTGRCGVTRAEVVVIAAAVFLALAIVLPMIGAARQKADDKVTEDRLRHIGTLVHVYHDVYESFPTGGTGRPPAKRPAGDSSAAPTPE